VSNDPGPLVLPDPWQSESKEQDDCIVGLTSAAKDFTEPLQSTEVEISALFVQANKKPTIAAATKTCFTKLNVEQ